MSGTDSTIPSPPTNLSRRFPRHHAPFDREMPSTLYKMFDDAGRLVYVGITSQDFTRIREHARLRSWWGSITRIELEHHASFLAASERERELVKSEHPLYNKQMQAPKP